MTEPSGPPSYVPTLTQVVHAVDEIPSRPPAFLTRSSEPDQPAAPELGQAADSAAGALASATVDSDAAQALLVARVLERVEQTLETGLHEALAPLIRAHLHELLPRLQDEIELTVRETVAQALEHESLSNPRV